MERRSNSLHQPEIITKEPLIVIVGYLGSGKTTLLRQMAILSLRLGKSPFVVLNDYQDATLDLQWFRTHLSGKQLSYLSGSCICCDGLGELRRSMVDRPARKNPLSLIEANGTSDAIELIAHLTVGVGSGLSKPIQISTVNCRWWQQDKRSKEIEIEQVRGANHIFLSHTDVTHNDRVQQIIISLRKICPFATISTDIDALSHELFSESDQSFPSRPNIGNQSHDIYHFASAEIPLPNQVSSTELANFLESLPSELLRVKGVVRIMEEDGQFFYFEKFADGTTSLRPFQVRPGYGTRLIAIGPGALEDHLSEIASKVFGKTSVLSKEKPNNLELNLKT